MKPIRICLIILALLAAMGGSWTMIQAAEHPTLKYLGHASIKIRTAGGTVIYVDPYAGSDYSEPADLILVTHGHGDHNQVGKVKQNPGCRVITHKEAIDDGAYQTFEAAGIHVRAVAAYNKNHAKNASVGYILQFDGIKLYHAGDTSRVPEMADLAAEKLTYALLPMDAVYNMGPEEAAECAGMIQAKYYIPIHTGPNGVFSEANISKFSVTGKIVVKPDETIELKG